MYIRVTLTSLKLVLLENNNIEYGVLISKTFMADTI